MRKAHGLGVFFMTALMSYLEISDCSEPCCAQEVVISPSEVLTLLNRRAGASLRLRRRREDSRFRLRRKPRPGKAA